MLHFCSASDWQAVFPGCQSIFTRQNSGIRVASSNSSLRMDQPLLKNHMNFFSNIGFSYESMWFWNTVIVLEQTLAMAQVEGKTRVQEDALWKSREG